MQCFYMYIILKWIGPLRFIYFFILIYVYVSSLLLSSENIYGTSLCEWVTQRDLNSLVWMVFSWLWVYLEVTFFFFFCVSTLVISLLIALWYFICFCHFTSGSCVCLLEWFQISLSYFSLCVSWASLFGCVVWNLLVIIFY